MAPAATELAPGVWRIPTTPADLVNTFALVDSDGSVTLVDCGLPFTTRRIVAGLAAAGRHPRDVTRILLTHAHSDHVGGAARVLTQTPANGAWVHGDDADWVRRGQSPPRDRRPPGLGRLLRRLPGGGYSPVDVAGELNDGDLLDVAGGLSVLHTPGHTPGHVSLLHEPTGVLITGDAIWNMRRRITWPVRAFCTDIALTYQTADRLGELDFSVAAFTHGPEIRDGAREAVRGFLSSAGRHR